MKQRNTNTQREKATKRSQEAIETTRRNHDAKGEERKVRCWAVDMGYTVVGMELCWVCRAATEVQTMLNVDELASSTLGNTALCLLRLFTSLYIFTENPLTEEERIKASHRHVTNWAHI